VNPLIETINNVDYSSICSMKNAGILQVEDEANEVFLLQHAFRQAGITNPVQVATDGQMAIDYLSGKGRFSDRSIHPLPGLILLDLKLPRRSGREVLEWLRSQPNLYKIVVIVFTSAQYVGDVDLAYELGANSFVIKPVEFSQYIEFARLLKGWWLQHNQFPQVSDFSWITPGIRAHIAQARQTT
jgi:CheY-like chemotaxis protein